MLLRRLPPRRQILLRAAIAPAIFAALALAALGPVLFQRGNRVPASPDGDLVCQFIPWRAFGFGQLRHGNFPLWNPYIFGGTPYFAGFQSALLYPPNWLHLILQLETAINWIIALHLFAAGYFVYLWCRGRGASIAAGILGGTMFMFSGPYFLHIYAGHLANLCVMVWTPLLLLALDKLRETGALQWCLLGVLAVAMQILGGHPQYVYYTGLISFLYVSIGMIRSRHRLPLAGGYFIIYAGACLLAAVQLLTGLQAAGESVRSGGTQYYFASMFALPPENLLTFFAPGILGKLPIAGDPSNAVAYFGRCYLWEMSVFMSISGLVLASVGAIAGYRKTLALSAAILITLILALGKHLPLYGLLFKYFPEYSSFRSVSKFTFLTSLFICALAASGFDLLLAQPKKFTAWALTAGGLAIILGLTGLVMEPSGQDSGEGGPWAWLLGVIVQSQECYTPPEQYRDPTFIRLSEKVAAHSIDWAAATLGAICIMLCVTRVRPQAAYLLIVLAGIELFVFAKHNFTTDEPDLNLPSAWLSAIRAESGDFRVANSGLPGGGENLYLDAGLFFGFQNLWGYDPGVLKRYAETLFASQGQNADQASQYLQLNKGTLGLFQMLRCRLVLQWAGNTPSAMELTSPLPLAQLVPNWVVSADRDQALSLINSTSFNPRQTVVLESAPGITPSQDGVSGPAEVVDSSTDWVEIKTITPAPTLLLITNNFSSGWRVVPIETSSQSDYQILPADHTLMAIPLLAGSHHFRIEYLPTAFRIGKWVSIAALFGYAGIFSLWLIRRSP